MDDTQPGQPTRPPVSLDFVGLSPLEQVGTLENGWTIQVRLTQTRARTFVSSVTLVCPEDAPQPVTAAAWRAVPIGAVVDQAMANYTDVMDTVDEQVTAEDQAWIDSWSAAPGGAGHSDLMYAQLAQRYENYISAGSRSPVEDLTKWMGASRATTSQRLQVARQRGMLDGLELTRSAKALLGIPGYEA